MLPNLVIAIGTSHRTRLTRRSARRMAADAMHAACRNVRGQGAIPISTVDTLTANRFGSWVDDFAIGLTEAALKEDVSIVGGEMAQMPDSYKPGTGSVVVTCVGLKESA